MQSSYLFANELRVHYLHWNLGEDGQAVVLLHGLASNARIWELVAPHLVRAGMVPLAPDQRGHGLTDKPDGDYGFETYFHDLAAWIETWHLEKPLLVGHSWGAMVALDYAARFPFGPRAPAGLVLVDGGMLQLDDVPGASWEETRARLTPPKLAGLPLEVFLTWMNNPQRSWRPDEKALSIILANFEILEETPAEAFSENDPTKTSSGEEIEVIHPHLSFEHHMQIVRAMWEFKTYERLARLHCPVLMIPAWPPEPHSEPERQFLALKEKGIARAQREIPNLQVYWMGDSIHDIPLQHPAELARLISEFSAAM
jgi:pimeloyl-ACP methyl ester carboxylesterase